MKEKIIAVLSILTCVGVFVAAGCAITNEYKCAVSAPEKADFQASTEEVVKTYVEETTAAETAEILTEAETNEEATEATVVETTEPELHRVAKHYGIWTGAYWHFTPEQIDAQWSGFKTSKPMLPTGTTRAWQDYLYQRLCEIGAEWFYPYACAQAMQESGMNPLNNVGRTQISWLNGEATYDCGLYSFKTKYWNAAYGDVCDYHANINAYIDRIAPHLAAGEANVKQAIAQHYDPYHYSEEYVQYVLGRLNELWEVE